LNKSRKRSTSTSSSNSEELDDFGRAVARNRIKKRTDEVERLAEMERQRRQKELETRFIEEEAAKIVAKKIEERVQEELEKRKHEIEAEVIRRVEEAKRSMEQQMLEELEKRRQAELAEQRKKEVMLPWLLCPLEVSPKTRHFLAWSTSRRKMFQCRVCVSFTI